MNGVDWVAHPLADGTSFTTYGRDPAVQVLVVLEGEARIEISGGPTLELKTGDMAALPKGVATRWHLTLPFKEMWVLA